MSNQDTAGWTEIELDFLKRRFRVMPHAEIGDVLGRSGGAVRNKCHELGLRKKAPDWTPDEIELLESYYHDDPVWIDELAQRLGRLKSNVSRKARELGLTSRERKRSEEFSAAISRRSKEWHRNNEHPRGFEGKKHSEETLSKISEASKGAWADPDSELNSAEQTQRRSDQMMERQANGKMRQGYTRAQSGGKRADLGGVYFRSKWEANYARYLNWLVGIGEIESWTFEEDTFVFNKIKRGARSYTPDFKIVKKTGDVEYHEIKGWMDQKSQTKLKRMRKYYPDVMLVVIDSDAYRALARDVKKLIPNWE